MTSQTETEKVPGETPDGATSMSWGALLALLGAAFAVMLLLMTANAAAHPYSGTGVVKSHTPWGSAMCNITVIEDNGGEEHTYQRSGGLPYCQGVEDGSIAHIESGMIKSFTTP